MDIFHHLVGTHELGHNIHTNNTNPFCRSVCLGSYNVAKSPGRCRVPSLLNFAVTEV